MKLLRFGPQVGAIVLAFSLGALGFFNFYQIPDRIESQIDRFAPGAVDDNMNRRLVELMGADYERLLEGLGNIEVGSHTLPHERRENPGGWFEIYRDWIEFESDFEEVPQVFLSISSMEAYFTADGNAWRVRTDGLTPKGFDIVVEGGYLASLSNARIERMAVDSVFKSLREGT